MAPTISKLLTASFPPFGCYEMGHTWTPSCSRAAFDIFSKTLLSGVKFYIPFYLAQNVFRKKYTTEDFMQVLIQTWWSSVFVSSHFTLMPALGCVLRQLLGRVYILPTLVIPLIVGFPALFIERGSRRKPLSIYTFELAADTLLRMLESRGLISFPRHGDVLAFALAMSIFLYSIRTRVKSQETVYHAIRYLLCSDEGKKEAPGDVNNNAAHICSTDEPTTLQSRINELLQRMFFILRLLPRHSSCTHRGSCVYNSLKDVPRLFLYGWLGVGGALAILKNLRSLRENPLRIFSLPFSSRPLTSGFFLAGYSFIYKAALCGLRWTLGSDRPELTIAAATIASPLVKLAPLDSMPFYLITKSLEFLIGKAEENKLLPRIPFATHWVYGLSACVLCYAISLEPQSIKPSFMRIIDFYTYPMLRKMNHHTMVRMGANTGFWGGRYPDLDLTKVQPAYLEHIALWLL